MPTSRAVIFEFSRFAQQGNKMVDKRGVSNLGVYVYGGAAVTLGVIGLVWSDFATNWQRVTRDVPHREVLAYLTASYEILGGAAILWRRTARIGALMMTALYSVFALLWVLQVIRSPQVYDPWGNFFEELSLVIAGVGLWAALAPADSPWQRRTAAIGRLYGVCVVSFALEQIISIQATASFVPKWIPPGQMFWAIATTVFFALAAASILSGILAGVASRLLAAMIVGFELLVWAPRLFTAPHEHFNWSANGISLAIAGGAWVVSDLICQPRAAASELQEPSPVAI
jgi:uncharacterized membrane protein YphA (DoxX/SURF4 family)